MSGLLKDVPRSFDELVKEEYGIKINSESSPQITEQNTIKERKAIVIDSVIAYGIVSVIGICKLDANSEEKQSKTQAILNIFQSNSKTNIGFLAEMLTCVFGVWKEKPLHWVYISENYTPKAIRSVIWEMSKHCKNGGLPIKTPGAYFTDIITNYHSRRRKPKRKLYSKKVKEIKLDN